MSVSRAGIFARGLGWRGVGMDWTLNTMIILYWLRSLDRCSFHFHFRRKPWLSWRGWCVWCSGFFRTVQNVEIRKQSETRGWTQTKKVGL